MEERLQKILSAQGICSRRKAEEYITQGLVKVNGKVAELGQKADPERDTIEVDGKVLSDRKNLLYYVINKPVGIVTTNADREDQQTIRDLLPAHLKDKVHTVGRLDKDSSGLLLLTNDGVLSYRLTHPSFDHEKEYRVTVEHPIKDGALDKLRKGVTIDGSKTKPATVKRIDERTFTIAITEGRNRQIRRMCQKVGSPVQTLHRVRITTFADPKLKEGAVRELSEEERAAILQSVGLE